MAAPVAEHTTAAIRATLVEAAKLGQGRASTAELGGAAVALRQHIEALLPDAEAHADTLWRGGQEWHRVRSTVDGIRAEIASPLPSSPLSGYVRVELLRRACAWLLEHYGPDAPREGS